MSDPILSEVRQLSSGTMATLTGKSAYADIDKIQAEFVSYVAGHPGEFKTWQDAWDAFNTRMTLVCPTEKAFRAAIVNISGGFITLEWMETAWSAANTWIRGQLESNSYGIGRLIVSWEWVDGTHTVNVERKP